LAVAPNAEAQAPLGTRAAGLAGAFVGVADDASAVYWNPAGLATGGIVSFLATFSEENTSSHDSQAVTGERLTGRMVALSLPPVGLAYYRLGTFGTERAASVVNGLPSREEVRRSVQALSPSVAGVSLLHSLSDYIVVGATPKVMWGGSTEVDVDAGVMVAVERVRVGLVARNLTTPSFAQAEGGEIELSREVRLGGAWGSGWPGHSRVMVSVDGDLTSRVTPVGAGGKRRDVAAGVETWWRDRRLGLRGGVRRSTIGEARAAVAAGVSAGLTPRMLLEAHVVQGQSDERGWSIGVRMGF
jgi:hypothetical protein